MLATVAPDWLRAQISADWVDRYEKRYGEAKEENRDKIIVFLAEAYGISHLAELAVLTGMRLHRFPPHLGSPQTILQRYGIGP